MSMSPPSPLPVDILTDAAYSTVTSESATARGMDTKIDLDSTSDEDNEKYTDVEDNMDGVCGVHTGNGTTEAVSGEDWSDDSINARVEVRDTNDKGRCMFSRIDNNNTILYPGDIVFAETPLQIVIPDTCPTLYQWLKAEEEDMLLELPVVWHMAALSSLLFLDNDKLARCYDKWSPPLDAPTNESQGEPSSNYPNCKDMLNRLIHGHIDIIPYNEREPWMVKLLELDPLNYTRLLLIWRFNSFGHHSITDGLIMYDKISMLSHSCEASCCWHYGPDDAFVLRARVPIQPGDEITISYIGDEELFKSTQVRQEKLQGWLFTCHCERCSRAVDYARGFRCIKCHAGVIYPYTQWKRGLERRKQKDNSDNVYWCTLPCTYCRRQLSFTDMEELENLEKQYEERLSITDSDDETDIELVYTEASKVFCRGCHWILHQMDLWLIILCRDKEDYLGTLAHQKDKSEFLSKVTPLANYSYAWSFEEMADTYQSLIAATASDITKASCYRMLNLYERTFYMLTVLCGSDHAFTQSALTKWSTVRDVLSGLEASNTTVDKEGEEEGEVKGDDDIANVSCNVSCHHQTLSYDVCQNSVTLLTTNTGQQQKGGGGDHQQQEEDPI